MSPSLLALAPQLIDEGLLFQRRLARHLRKRLSPARTLDALEDDGAEDDHAAADDLQRFIASESALVGEQAAEAPADPAGFVTWFERLRDDGPGQGDELFPWLAEAASEEEMLWFLTQELAGEAGFDDLIALTLVRMPPRPKMEMARNLWDEFGRGNPLGVHGQLLARTADDLHLSCPLDEACEPALALANLMAGMALGRDAFRSAGALGVIELTAPGRVSCVADGMRRLKMPASARRYFELHATIDIEHSRRWDSEVLFPLVEADARCARHLAEGALMRLQAGARCFAYYRTMLDVA